MSVSLPTIAKFSENVIKVASTKGTFLGRDCEVLHESPCLSLREIGASIEATFDRVIKINPNATFNNLARLRAAIKFYGWMLFQQNFDLRTLKETIHPELSGIIGKIDRELASIHPDSKRADPLPKQLSKLTEYYSKLSSEEFFTEKNLKDVQRVMTLLLVDVYGLEAQELETYKLSFQYFLLRDLPAMVVGQSMELSSLKSVFPSNGPAKHGWPIKLYDELQELSASHFGLSLVLSAILNRNTLVTQSRGVVIETTEITDQEAVEYPKIFNEALQSPDLPDLTRSWIIYLYRTMFDRTVGLKQIEKLPDKKNLPRISLSQSKAYLSMINEVRFSSHRLPWENSVDFNFQTQAALYLASNAQLPHFLRKQAVHQQAMRDKESDCLLLASVKQGLELKLNHLTCPSTDKDAHSELEDISPENVQSIQAKLAQEVRELELRILKEVQETEKARHRFIQEEEIPFKILHCFTDLPKRYTFIQLHFSYLPAYEKLYNLLRDRIFHPPDLSKNQKLKSFSARRPTFAESTDPLFPEKLIEVLETKIAPPEQKEGASSSKGPKADPSKKTIPSPDNKSKETNASPSKQEEVLQPDPSNKDFASPQTPSHLSYGSWVTDWFTDAEKALARPQYSNIKDHPAIVAKVIAFHTLPIEIDQFLFPFGIKSMYQDSKTKQNLVHYSIPCEIKFGFDGKLYRGSIGYCVNPEGVYFHRCFSEKAPDQMVSGILEKGFWEIDYPALIPSSENSRPAQAKKQASYGGVGIREINSYTIEIKDPKNQATIKIFNMNWLTPKPSSSG